MSDIAELLKVEPENGYANKPVRNSMFLTAVTPHVGRSRTNSKSVSNIADDIKKDSVALEEENSLLKIPAMELAADLVSIFER